MFRIRPVRAVELPLISALQKSGGAYFRAVGMDRVAGSPAPDPQTYEGAHSEGRLFVAVDPADTPIGFIRIEMVDGEPHVEQVSVHPDYSGKGIGSILMRTAEDWARLHGFTRLTLTTFRDVPWNGPFYSRLGWSPLPESEWGPELAAIRQHERDLGFDVWPRQAMIKSV
jgi:GNAT superfamily N-acetyltransferase